MFEQMSEVWDPKVSQRASGFLAGATGWVVVPLAGIGSAILADLGTHTPLSPDKTEPPVPRHRSSNKLLKQSSYKTSKSQAPTI